MKFTHRKLCEDLAHVKGTKFFEVPLGSVWGGNVQIADVITVKPSYTRFLIDIYEVKVSRSDFLKEIRSGKWEGYLNHCNRFYFALLSGIAKKEEIPEGVGLIVRGDTGWSIVKMAKKRDQLVPYGTMMAMLFKKQSQDNFERRSYVANYSRSNSYWLNDGLKKILNPKVRKALRFYDNFSRHEEKITKMTKNGSIYD